MTQRHHGQFNSDPLALQPSPCMITSPGGVLCSLFGRIAWTVVVPTLLMVAVGIFIDQRTIGKFSWTVFMAIIGGAVGSVNILLWLWCSHAHRVQKRPL